MDDRRLIVSFVAMREGAMPPSYATADSAGADIRACTDGDIVIAGGDCKRIPTGFAMALPRGYEGQVRPRSGLAAKFGVTVLNAPGTIDADYRGEVQVLLMNFGKEPFVVHDGDRIAQLVIAPCRQATFVATDDLNDTERGRGGFGSTGV